MVRRCVACGVLVENVPRRVGPFDLVLDDRVPEDVAVIGPPLCWHCRGLELGKLTGG